MTDGFEAFFNEWRKQEGADVNEALKAVFHEFYLAGTIEEELRKGKERRG